MARTFRRKESLGALSEINVTPLIDLAFALLIIFIITAPLLEQSIALELPLESQSGRADPERIAVQTVSIQRDGTIYWNEETVTEEQLTANLERLAFEREPPVIAIRADRRIPYQRVINVIDLIQQNGLTRISLDTQIK